MPKQKWLKLFQASLESRDSSEAIVAGDSLDKELAGCRFSDPRLGRRFRKFARQLSTRLGQAIPLACQDWTNTKAAYRFLSNRRVSESAILAGHFQATHERFAASEGPVLVLHDTTEFSYTRESKESIGALYKSCGRKEKDGRPRLHTVCGISYAFQPGGDRGGTAAGAGRDQALTRDFEAPGPKGSPAFPMKILASLPTFRPARTAAFPLLLFGTDSFWRHTASDHREAGSKQISGELP